VIAVSPAQPRSRKARNKRPQLSDLREIRRQSEQDADLILFVHPRGDVSTTTPELEKAALN